MAKKKKLDVTALYANRSTKRTVQGGSAANTQAPNPALAKSIVDTVTKQSAGRQTAVSPAGTTTTTGSTSPKAAAFAARLASEQPNSGATGAQTSRAGTTLVKGAKRGTVKETGTQNGSRGVWDSSTPLPHGTNMTNIRLSGSGIANLGYTKGADPADGDRDSVMKAYQESRKQANAIIESYEKGEGVYDEKDYALAKEEAERYQALFDRRAAEQMTNAKDMRDLRELGADTKLGISSIVQNPVLWAEGVMGSAVDGAAGGIASIGATGMEFVNNQLARREGEAALDAESLERGKRWEENLRNFAAANAESAAQERQNAIETAGNTKFGAFATDLGVAGAQMYIDALTGTVLGTGTMAPMLARSFGYGAQEAADKGFGVTGQVLNGVKSAGVEYVSERLFGGNPVYDADAGLVNKLLGKVLDENSQLIRVLASKPADIVYEGLEEVVSDLLNPLIDQGALWLTGDERIEVDWPKAEELLRDFAIGSALSAASNLATGQSVGSEPAQQQTVNQTQNAPAQNAEADAAFASAVREEVASRQDAQDVEQQAAQTTEAGIAPQAENAASGAFNTAETAQEAAPTQTVADIYANRGTRQQNIDNAAQTAYTDNSNNTVSGGMTDDAGRSAETNRDGVSGVYTGRNADDQGRAGLDGTSIGSGRVLSDQAKSTIQSRGVAFAETHDVTADSAAFSVSLDEARASNPQNGWAVTPKSAQEIEENGVRVYMDENDSVGFGIAPDGDIEAVFANKQKGAPAQSANSIIPQAIAAGGTKLDCYGSGLVRLYSKYGFVPVARVAFNAEYANDGWDASKGTPDIYFMMATDTDADSVVANYGQYKVWSQAELDALPLMEYDEAYAYRDSLLEQAQAESNAGATPESGAVYVPAQTEATADGRDMGEGSVSPEDSTGAAPAGFDRVSQWQMEAAEYHPVNEEAAQTTLENRGRVPMDIPTTDRNGRQVSKLVSTLANANITTNEAAAAIAEDARNGVFSALAYTDEAAAQKANDHIEKVGWDVAFGEFRNDVMNGRVSKDINMLGIALYNNAVNAGALADAMDVVALLTHGSARNAAQALQVLNMINKASPESRLYLAMRGLGTLVEDAQKRYGKRAENLTIDDALLQQYKDAMMSGDEKAAEKTWNQIIRDVAQQIPASFAEKLNNWRYLSMLGNPRTHVRNLAGNLGFAPVRVVSNMISTGIQSVVLDKANRRRAYMNFAKGENRDRFTAAWKYYGKAMESTQDGGKYSDAINEVDKARTIFRFKPLEALRKGNSKALDIEDQWFSQPAFAYALSSYMAAHNIAAEELNAPTMSDEMAKGIEYAVNEARRATYRDSNVFSDWVAKAGEGNKVTRGIKDAVMPFKRTPANILVRGVEYSPVGLVKGLTYDLVQVKKGNMEAAQAIDNISAGLTGTGLLALGIYLASQGLITASGDPEDEDQNWFNDLMGYQNYALNVGDKSVTIDWLAPGVMPLFVGVELQKAFADEKMTLSESLSALGNLTNPMVETSMLSSIDDLLDTIQNSDSPLPAIESVAASYLSQYIPTLTGQLERTIEKQRYETYRYSDTGALGLSPTAQSQLGKLLNKIPGVEFSQIPYIDAWGREEESGSIGTRIFNNFLNPAYVNDIQRGEVEEELQRLHDENYSGVLPDRPSQSTKIQQLGGEHMTKDEYVQYARTSGSESLKMISELIHSDYYDKLDDDEKAKLVSELYSLATDEAKRQIVTGRGIDYSSDYDKYQSIEDPVLYLAMKEALGDLADSAGKDSGAFTAVYNQWKGLSSGERAKYTEGIAGEFDGIGSLEKLDACLRSGMNTEEFFAVKEKFNEVNKTSGMSASEKRAAFVNWLDTKSGLSAREKATVLENFRYTTTLVADEGNYEKMVEAGVSDAGSLRVFNAIQALEPATGYTNVADWQKIETITSSSLSEQEQLAAISVYASESAAGYYQAAYDNGIPLRIWSTVQANIRSYGGTYDRDGNKNGGTVSMSNLIRAMYAAGMSGNQMRAMFNEYKADKGWTASFDTAWDKVDWSWWGY